VTVGVFQTSSSMTMRAAPGESWYEVSDIEPRARSIQNSRRPSAQRMILVVDESAEPPLDRTTLPAPGADRVDAIWQRFMAHHVLRLPENPSAYFRSSYVRVARMLRDPRTVPVLKGLLKSHGGVDIAGLLHELGDPSGLEFLKRQLESNVVSSKIQAARAITDTGDTAGIDALLDLEKSKPLDFARQSYSILSSFEKFVASRDPDDKTRIRVLDFVFSKLSETRYQSTGFRVVKRVAGSDFGYSLSRNIGAVSTGAVRRSSTELREAREKAIADARAWWKTERSRVAKDG
jgi:hypothetical protein